ncbi:MAG: response regulator [Planctomycetota bacterium]|nr:MAG: response regulator [Planctomycetota bacterium]
MSSHYRAIVGAANQLLEAADGETVEGRRLRILVADDDPIFRKRGLTILRSVAEVSQAEDGKQAIFAVDQAYARGRPFDVVITDIYMPGVDGLAAVRAIRSMEQARGSGLSLRLIISSVARSPMLIQQHAGGLVDAYFVKPLDRRLLMRRLVEWGLLERLDNGGPQTTRLHRRKEN